MKVARELQTATLLPDGRVLIAGGDSGLTDPAASSVAVYASAEIYDPESGKFSSAGSMAVARSGAAAVQLPDGRVLVAGGEGGDQNPIASAELYVPSSGKWMPTGSLAVSVWEPPTARLVDGRVLFIEGSDPAELFDPATGTLRKTAAPPPSQQGAFNTATTLDNGRVLLLMGDDPSAYLFWP
jgi:hypothetical protein